MIKGIAGGIWAALCVSTLTTGETSVISQALAQGTLSIILIIAAFSND
ncbi:acridine resistance protein [Klebsiella phage KP179]|jgi:hypothetical protein|uniref:Acridine resistance protein n=2 Tax=Jiaodavirus TaxID=1985325 RepID=A0A386K9F1_9CAUD|nr:hypothetical protein [Klebsiella variicola]YP_010098688.1 acridine resistance protein [Klebsiella phage KP179]QEG11410.1 acridine resistance protein [Klebsiella phage KMI13]QEG11840.1 hypothetical protein KPN6_95 [Klebsiella phage KPN6]QPX73890.1 putative acridine resistance protein [Klebsiella phage vB_KpnM_BovinicusUrsus]UCR74201.1 hypothetical protein [Klebsiella phage vB_KpnM_5N]UJP30180.1 hypothetical protein [Klebsiella phage Kpn6N]UOK17874.1 hypothetical protein KP1079_00268 [Klebs